MNRMARSSGLRRRGPSSSQCLRCETSQTEAHPGSVYQPPEYARTGAERPSVNACCPLASSESPRLTPSGLPRWLGRASAVLTAAETVYLPRQEQLILEFLHILQKFHAIPRS
ncbi:hypothetical protein JOC55_004083 [Paenibacillus sacheonensis]|nr:hypothetical protein [Paenibacillus sacheonensis]